MKTKIKIAITVCAFVAALNANATVDYKVKNSGFISTEESLSALNEKIVSVESETNGNIDFQKEAQMVTQWIADKEEAKAFKNVMDRGFIAPTETFSSSENEVAKETLNETTDFVKEARIINKLIADKAEAKAIQNMMNRGLVVPKETIIFLENEVANENNDVIVDFEKEAQLMIKLVADKEEAKVAQKLIDEGKL